MGVIRSSIAACALVASAGALAAVPLDGLIDFDDGYRCVPASDFDALLGGVIRWEELKLPDRLNDIYEGSVAPPPVPEAYRDRVGTPILRIEGDDYRVTLPLDGSWRGLALHSLVVFQRPESEGGFYLLFDAPREEVLKAANEAGFRLPPSGSASREGEVMDVHVGVDTYDGRAALYCAEG